MLKRIGLQNYILAMITIVILITVLSSAFTLSVTRKTADSTSENAIVTTNIIALSIGISSIHSALSPLIMEKDPDVMESSIVKINQQVTKVETDLKACRNECDQIIKIFKSYKNILNELIEKKILLGKTSEAIEFFIQDLSPEYLKALNELDRKSVIIKDATTLAISTAKIEGQKLQYSLIFSSVLMIVLIGVGGFYFKRSLVIALTQITDKLESSTVMLKDTSHAVATTSDFLSESSTQQNASIQGTSQAVHEISAMTDTNREHVLISTNSSRQNLHKIGEGKEALDHMLTAIQKISESNQQIFQQISKNESEFNEVINLINEIDNKTKIINDIVFQTKLLSFNASVEAARAGEQGKGFSVVAQEIGNLAQMSGTAAMDISSLLNNSVRRVNEIVTGSHQSMVGIMEAGKLNLAEGNDAVNECHTIFEEITVDSEKISLMLEEINAKTLEQSKGITEVNKSMNEITVTANTNAQMAQNSLETAEKLNIQSNSIAEVTADLSLVLGGKNKQ